MLKPRTCLSRPAGLPVSSDTLTSPDGRSMSCLSSRTTLNLTFSLNHAVPCLAQLALPARIILNDLIYLLRRDCVGGWGGETTILLLSLSVFPYLRILFFHLTLLLFFSFRLSSSPPPSLVLRPCVRVLQLWAKSPSLSSIREPRTPAGVPVVWFKSHGLSSHVHMPSNSVGLTRAASNSPHIV